jgi:hypothetical protein
MTNVEAGQMIRGENLFGNQKLIVEKIINKKNGLIEVFLRKITGFGRTKKIGSVVTTTEDQFWENTKLIDYYISHLSKKLCSRFNNQFNVNDFIFKGNGFYSIEADVHLFRTLNTINDLDKIEQNLVKQLIIFYEILKRGKY